MKASFDSNFCALFNGVLGKFLTTPLLDLENAQKDPLTVDELIATLIDFSKFAKNRLKLDKITKEFLVGPTIPKGDRCPFDLSKPLPLKGRLGHLTVPAEYFFSNDLEYLKSENVKRKYTTSITKKKAARYQINRLSKHDVYLTVKILSMLFHLDGDVIVDLAVALRMFTRSIVIQKRVEDVQLGVERVVYEDLSNRKRLMRADELYKFSDETLKLVRDTLHYRLRNFRLGYNKGMPNRKWSAKDQKRSGVMVELIEEQLLERRIMRNLERLFGAMELGMDYRLMQRITKTELTLEQTQQGVSDEVLSIHSDDGNPTSANIKQALRQVFSTVVAAIAPHYQNVIDDTVDDDNVDDDNVDDDGVDGSNVDDASVHGGDVNVDSDEIDDTNIKSTSVDDDDFDEIDVDNMNAYDFALWPSCEDFPADHPSQYYFHMSTLNCHVLGTPLAAHGFALWPSCEDFPAGHPSQPQPMWDLPRVSHIFDPRNWDGLSTDMIKVLVKKGPKRDNSINKGPKDRLSQRFSAAFFIRVLPNSEKCDREWLVYSKELDNFFCFCCKIFKKGVVKGSLANEGFSDWIHLGTRLKEHEVGVEHITNMVTWFDMRHRLKKNEMFLAKHILAFRGTNEKLHVNSNGNFLGLIEMFEEFDPFIKEHVRRITNDEIHVHYLGHSIQNESKQLLSRGIRSQIIQKIKQAKSFSVILDCTPNASHQEQMSLILWYVNISSICVRVEESFLGFVNVDDTTGQGLFDVTQAKLESLDLDIDDVRSQGYDNGSCGKAMEFFGVIQRIYTIFVNSSKRWLNLKENVKGLTLKSLSITRWKSRVESVIAIRYQLSEIREALLQVAEKDNDSKIKSESKSLATNELGDFDFLVATIIWFDILSAVNLVSKRLQSDDMLIDVAIKEVEWLILFFKKFKDTGFDKAMNLAKEIAIEMDIDPIFRQKHIIRRKRQFDEISNDQDTSYSAEEAFKLYSFVDNTLKSHCSHLEVALKNSERSDVDANELYMELRLLSNYFPNKNLGPVDILNFLKERDFFPNAIIAYRVLLTIPVTMASAERSFSKLKLLKSYLRSTMSQERLNGLALIATENE
ncbi:zinc finger MYM-type protein 1-like protein [Tanacetum coccineum]